MFCGLPPKRGDPFSGVGVAESFLIDFVVRPFWGTFLGISGFGLICCGGISIGGGIGGRGRLV